MKFPKIYIDFQKLIKRYIPKSLVGTDITNERFNLKEEAIELLKENDVANFLKEDDHVFMMHQGYVFFYFKADGNPDPVVYGYDEMSKQRREHGTLSSFLMKYISEDNA